MKEIKLTRGKVALVDDEDYEYLNQFKWYPLKSGKTFYAQRYYKISTRYYSCIFMHRDIMHTPKGQEVDHIDHNGLNNQKSNLRNCTRRQNSFNRTKQKNSNGYIGVLIRPENGKYSARIQVNGKAMILGCFKTAEEAAMVRDAAAKKYYGEYAKLNFESCID